ncbi:MAG: ArsA-related P-loop ATPase [Myxococcota bacterium]
MDRLIANHDVVVCTGAGGVGKTTTAAVIGLRAASLGKHTLIVTIDPARRLAQALGHRTLAATPQAVGSQFFVQAGIKQHAAVSVMMLDMQAAWDDLVGRLCTDKGLARRLLDNRFYRYLSRELPGSQEFIAAESLYTLHERGEFDQIVLDTPPTVHALDFLEAPNKMGQFLQQDAFRLFLRSKPNLTGRLGLGLLDQVGPVAQMFLKRFVGNTFLDELAAFLHLLQDLYDPLMQRTQAFEQLLKSDSTRFVVVLSSAWNAVCESKQLHEQLLKRGFPFGLFVLNGVSRLAMGPAQQLVRTPKQLRQLLQHTGCLLEQDSAFVDALAAVCQNEHSNSVWQHRAIEQLKQLQRPGNQAGEFGLVCLPKVAPTRHPAVFLGQLVRGFSEAHADESRFGN